MSIKTNANALLEVQESAQTAAHTFQLEVKADIPGEPQVSTETILLQGKNVESSENLVMKFASGYSSKVHNFQGANPFKAIGIRNDHTKASKWSPNQLYLADQESSSHVDKIENTEYVGYGSGGDKTYYRTSTVTNGLNEKGTEILDFEYWFPVDSSNGDDTYRQYAPMSETNAQWDVARPNGEEAKYACLDSGQGCGGGITEHSLSGDWKSTTERSDFTGYKVEQRNFNNDVDNLLSADSDGQNAGNGIGSDTDFRRI